MSHPFAAWGVPGSDAAYEGDGLSDETLLQVCRATLEDAESMPEWMDELRWVPRLIQPRRHVSHLSSAVTLLAFLLGELPRHNPVHLPFGYAGPQMRSAKWIDLDTLDRIGKQIVGLVLHDLDPEKVAFEVQYAIAQASQLGFIEQKDYDAWRPGMASGSGWRSAVMATPYGLAKARSLGAAMGVVESRPKHHVASDNQMHPTSAVAAPPARTHGEAKTEPASEQYRWARQIELIHATNQVLGEGMLHKGVLSRACRSRQIETNGQPGRASRVSVTHFMTWAAQQFSIGNDEQIQLRNAIIGEINARNL